MVGVLVLVFMTMIVVLSVQLHKLSYLLVAMGGILLTILYLIDKAFFTSYLLQTDGLVIRNQFMEVRFPYRDMRSLRHGTFWSLWSLGKHKRFALSSHNLIVELNEGPWRTISLSPFQEKEFINQILKNIDLDRSTRATASHHHSAA